MKAEEQAVEQHERVVEGVRERARSAVAGPQEPCGDARHGDEDLPLERGTDTDRAGSALCEDPVK